MGEFELDPSDQAEMVEQAEAKMKEAGCGCSATFVSLGVCEDGHIHEVAMHHDDDCALVVRVSRIQAARWN
jgi:hypothetical protein